VAAGVYTSLPPLQQQRAGVQSVRACVPRQSLCVIHQKSPPGWPRTRRSLRRLRCLCTPAAKQSAAGPARCARRHRCAAQARSGVWWTACLRRRGARGGGPGVALGQASPALIACHACMPPQARLPGTKQPQGSTQYARAPSGISAPHKTAAWRRGAAPPQRRPLPNIRTRGGAAMCKPFKPCTPWAPGPCLKPTRPSLAQLAHWLGEPLLPQTPLHAFWTGSGERLRVHGCVCSSGQAVEDASTSTTMPSKNARSAFLDGGFRPDRRLPSSGRYSSIPQRPH